MTLRILSGYPTFPSEHQPLLYIIYLQLFAESFTEELFSTILIIGLYLNLSLLYNYKNYLIIRILYGKELLVDTLKGWWTEMRYYLYLRY